MVNHMPRKPNYDRDDLINRAKDLFWQRGWAGTSMKDLEAELDLKPGSFYAAFGSKEGLFALALGQYATQSTARLNDLVEKHGALKALQLLPSLVVSNDNAPAKACMLSKTLLELQSQNHALADQASDYLLGMETRFAELFEQAQATGEIDRHTTPQVLARKYQSDLLGLRISAERPDVDAAAIATEMAETVARF